MAEIAVGVAGVVLGGLALYKYNMPTITTQSQFGRLLTADTAAALPEAKVMHDPRDSVKLLQDSSKLWQIPYAELTFSYLLGKGSQGEVFRGIWRGAAVAIKRIDTRLVDSNILEEFCMEADINMRLKHPNLTLFMGLSLEHPYLCIVSEFVQRGSLFDLLRDDESTALTWRRAIYIARDVARGMAYMHDHNPPILHRDLKSLNILVTKQWTGKIADFGMTRFAEHGEAMTQCGSPLWMAPEMICNQAYDQKADVFSFAICLWELYTHQIPYRSLDLSPSKVVYEVVRHNLRPEIPASCPQRWVTLLECCWAFDAKVLFFIFVLLKWLYSTGSSYLFRNRSRARRHAFRPCHYRARTSHFRSCS
jgi:serine/threonine protein kinase